MKQVSNSIAKFINEKFEPSVRDNKNKRIKILFQNQMISNYKMSEGILTEIFNKHVSPGSDKDKFSLYVYYRTRKLSNLILKNKVW